jgi:hypothetical protein
LIAILLTFPVRAQAQPKDPQGELLDIGPVPLGPLAKPSDDDLRGVEVILSTKEETIKAVRDHQSGQEYFSRTRHPPHP